MRGDSPLCFNLSGMTCLQVIEILGSFTSLCQMACLKTTSLMLPPSMMIKSPAFDGYPVDSAEKMPPKFWWVSRGFRENQNANGLCLWDSIVPCFGEMLENQSGFECRDSGDTPWLEFEHVFVATAIPYSNRTTTGKPDRWFSWWQVIWWTKHPQGLLPRKYPYRTASKNPGTCGRTHWRDHSTISKLSVERHGR